MEGRGGTDIGIKLIVTCDVGISLHSKIQIHCSYSTVMAQAHSVMHTSIRALFPCAFYTITICPFLIQRIFFHLHVPYPVILPLDIQLLISETCLVIVGL